MMWWWGDGGGMGAAGWIGMIFMILFWIAVVVGIVYLIRYLVSRPSGDTRRESQFGPSPQEGKPDALRTLEDRYAKGEIDREEFLQRRNDLMGKSG